MNEPLNEAIAEAFVEQRARNNTKQELTAKFIKSLNPAPTGKRVEFWDTKIDGFGIRVTDRGVKSFVLFKRWPPANVPARRRIGDADVLSLAEARKIAEEWIHLLALGKDPKAEKEKARQEELRKRQVTFAAVAEDWFAGPVTKQRRGHQVERDVRREFLPIWGARPITNISTLDIRNAVAAKATAAPAQARNLLGHLKCLLSWAVEQHAYGITDNPVAVLKSKSLIGKKIARKRVLTDDEMQAFWRAASRTPYPYGPLLRLLLLTGLRESEIAKGHWREINLAKRQWYIPLERAKTDEPFILQLTDTIVEILESLPRFKKGGHLFSTSWGEWPVNGFGNAKVRLDRRMTKTLRAMGRQRGEDPDNVELKPWRFHDLRRTMRTHLSALPIPDVVRELLISHKQQGIRAVYDQFKYEDEKLHALELWEARLRGIVTPKPVTPNVVALRAGA
jgi:integrase